MLHVPRKHLRETSALDHSGHPGAFSQANPTEEVDSNAGMSAPGTRRGAPVSEKAPYPGRFERFDEAGLHDSEELSRETSYAVLSIGLFTPPFWCLRHMAAEARPGKLCFRFGSSSARRQG